MECAGFARHAKDRGSATDTSSLVTAYSRLLGVTSVYSVSLCGYHHRATRNFGRDMTEEVESKMYRRQIILEDGRYLVFYTFDDADATSTEKSNEQSHDQRED